MFSFKSTNPINALVLKKSYLLLSFLILCFQLCFSQEAEEAVIDGQIVVPNQTSPEGIHIFNRSNNHGSVATPGGRFELLMKTGDTLYFSGIQFESVEVLVTEAIMISGMIRVEIREGLNQLPEVVVKDHDLSGDLRADTQLIEIEDFAIPVVPPPIGLPTGVQTVSNTALNEISGGANLLGLLGAAIGTLIPKRIRKVPVEQHSSVEQIKLRQRLRELLGDDFFVENLGLGKEEVGAFLHFAVDSDFQSSMLQEKQRLDLFQFLMEKEEKFRGVEK